ncbi:glycoside hydrolase family 31 protein [Flavobacteriaceae bacterium]|nr:glycoside hydrolase family 31 protein [Flavobacteriaceae bacterium]
MILNEQIERKGNAFPVGLKKFSKNVDTIDFHATNGVILRMTILRDSVVRFRYTTDGQFENDFSYAIAEDAVNGYNKLQVTEDDDKCIITTAKLVINIFKKDLRSEIFDAIDGALINEDELGFHWEESYEMGGNIVKMTKNSPKGEAFYGLGDKPEHSNLKGKRFQNWATDSYAFGRNTDPIYKAIPFYTALNHKKAYGIFFDNSFRSHFDFCHERSNATSFWAEGGEMNYYFIYGPNMQDVVASYTNLTGTPELPPLWALGYHQCKWSYYPESNVKEITQKFRDLKIPCDAIYLDIDYMEGFRCFTWSKDYFPDPKRMVQELKDDGFKTVVIIDPGIKIDLEYSVFKEGLEKDYFCRRADGPHMKGKVWPGECYFPDFTREVVRDWWAEQFKGLIEDTGVQGVWNDMNEPAVMDVPGKSFPDDVRHDYDGNPCSHRKAHNVYGGQMAKATYQGLKKYNYPLRPFVITRSAYSGTQRYTSTWLGDNVATWEHLWIANVQAQRMCMSGFSFVGSDIGGFAEQPNGELYARWIQLGIFHPFCRTHSSGDHGDQEPWTFGDEITDVVRKFINIRYELLPYLYTTFYKYIEEGIPMLKSLVLFDQEDTQTQFRTDEFMAGEHILACPIGEPNAKGRRMYIPRGKWYNFWNNEVVEGGKEIWVDADLDSMPIFVKAGAILPKWPVQQYVGEIEIEQLTLDVFFNEGTSVSELFEDANDGYDYTKGRYSFRHFDLKGAPNKLRIKQHVTGKFETSYETFKINLIGLPFKIQKVILDGEEINVEILNNTLEIPKGFHNIQFVG